MISICFILICFFEIQLSLPLKAIYKVDKKTLEIMVEMDEIKSLTQYVNIRIENQIYPFKIQNISEIIIDEKELKSYQIVDLESPKSFQNNQIIEIYLLDKKEKIIKKLKKIIQ